MQHIAIYVLVNLFFLSLKFFSQSQTPSSPPQNPPSPASVFTSMLLPFLIIFLAFYLLIIRPQKKQEQERKKMLQNLQKNDYVLTSGGIYGTILQVKDDEVTFKIDDNVKVKLAKNAIVSVISKAKTTEQK
ncbi:MAG: preprotein translocase subunit YajC [Planctomycetota bacterium]